jgi:hypothetical protein
MRGLHIVCLIGILMSSLSPAYGQKVDPAKIAAKQGGKMMNRLMRKGQRWVKRSVRELRKGSETPIEEQVIRPRFRVIGTEPTWLLEEGGHRGHRYNLLTDLVVGEYDIHLLTGGPRNQAAATGWLVDYPIYDTARFRNEELKILVSLSCYGDFGPVSQRANFYADFLQSKRLQNATIDSLRSYYWAGTDPIIDGIVVDFNDVPTQLSKEYLGFLRSLKTSLGLPLLLRLPSLKEGTHVYQAELLEKFGTTDKELIDAFLLNGYGYHLSNELSSTSMIGTAEGRGIAAAVAYYEAEGSGIPRDKMVIDFPNFGVVWVKRGNGYVPDPVQPYKSLDDIPNGAAKRSEDGSYVYLFSGDRSRAYTYDSEELIQEKYDWVEKAGLAGIGVYGLGYNLEGDTWKTVSTQFADSPPKTVYPALAFLLMFLWAGIAGSVIKYWQVRNEIARKRGHQWFYGIAVVLIALVVVFCLWPPIPPAAVAGSSTLLIMFPFLRRIRSMFRKWGL